MHFLCKYLRAAKNQSFTIKNLGKFFFIYFSYPVVVAVAGDKSLPDGWKIRSHQWWCQKRNSHRIHYEFLSPQNEFFKSRKAVVEHMTHAGLYTRQQIEMARLQTTPGSAAAAADKSKPLAAAASFSAAAGNAAATNRLSAASGGALEADGDAADQPANVWKIGSSSLPPGWRLKRHPYAGHTVYFYMSPGGDIFKTRRAILDYMWEDGGYTEKEFSAVITGGGERREAVLRELYEAKMRGTQQSNNDGGEEDNPADNGGRPAGEEGTEMGEIDLEELDMAGDEDEHLQEVVVVKPEDGGGGGSSRRSAASKRIKVEKEPILPTRRSGRVASKIKRHRLDSESNGGGGGASDGEEAAAPAKRSREDDGGDVSGGRGGRKWPPRGGRQLSKMDAAESTEKDEEKTTVEGLNSEHAKAEAETIVPELPEAMEDDGGLVAEEEEGEAASGDLNVPEGGKKAAAFFEDSIQYLKEESEEVGKEGSASMEVQEEEEMEPEPNQTEVESEEQEGPSLVRVSSSSVERSAYNVVVNVLSDLVSTISD
jgi:hypothetical protein